MKNITQRQLRNNSAAVMDAIEAGETYCITRTVLKWQKIRPIFRRHRLTTQELVEKYRKLPRVSYAEMKQEADDFFGTEDRLGEVRPRGDIHA